MKMTTCCLKIQIGYMPTDRRDLPIETPCLRQKTLCSFHHFFWFLKKLLQADFLLFLGKVHLLSFTVEGRYPSCI